MKKKGFIMKKKGFIFLWTVLAFMVSCTTNDQINAPDNIRNIAQTPIGFSVQKQNITRATNMEAVKHYNFGVWAWKVEGRNGLTDAEIMNNNLVGYSDGVSKGYDNTNASTWASSSGTVYDQKSPWFYEKLGNTEYTYTGDAGFYTAAELLPSNRYCADKQFDDNYPLLREEQDRLISEGYFDYIVTSYFCEAEWDNYELIQEEAVPYIDYTGEEILDGYKLYKKI